MMSLAAHLKDHGAVRVAGFNFLFNFRVVDFVLISILRQLLWSKGNLNEVFLFLLYLWRVSTVKNNCQLTQLNKNKKTGHQGGDQGRGVGRTRNQAFWAACLGLEMWLCNTPWAAQLLQVTRVCWQHSTQTVAVHTYLLTSPPLPHTPGWSCEWSCP